MKELNLARQILAERKKQGLTQEALADAMGVTKASVSKWETGQSYPDIELLPRLAAFFNISVDALLAYEPQISKEKIRALYQAFAADFQSKPAADVVAEIQNVADKHFAAYPLILQMGVLLVNHCTLAQDPSEGQRMIQQAQDYFERVLQGADSSELVIQAKELLAFCAIQLGDFDGALTILESTSLQQGFPEGLQIIAHRSLGQLTEADKVAQMSMYQGIVKLMNLLSLSLSCRGDQVDIVDETAVRGKAIIEIFNLEKLHPGQVTSFYLTLAQSYTVLGEKKKALDYIERYAEYVTRNELDFSLHGDDFFDRIDEGIDEALILGKETVRDEATIRASLSAAVVENPVFAALADNERFQRALLYFDKLK